MITIYYSFFHWITFGVNPDSHEIELAISAVSGYLYLLSFLRALRPVGHYIVIINRIFT